jgi:hypothetical protein
MASGYQVNGTDLDSIFAPYHSGWPQAGVTNMQVAGADLNARYAPLSTGTAAAATNYRVGGTDLNAIFAAAGSTGVIVSTQPANVSGSAAAGNPSGTVTSSSATCAFARGSGSYTYQWNCTNCTADSPNSATTTFSATVGAATTDNASAYCTGSDGVTSANTNTIAVTLTNTSPASQAFSITAASWSNQTTAEVGYNATGAHGSATNTTLPGGYTINGLDDSDASGQLGSSFGITGFSSNPGQNYIASVVANGVTRDSSAATYSYSSGLATWSWPGDQFGFAAGNTYDCTLNF